MIRSSLAALTCALSISACSAPGIPGSGVAAEEMRDVQAFEKLKVSGGGIDVTVLCGGPAAALQLRGDDNLLTYITTEVRSGTLYVHWKNGSYNPRLGMDVTVGTPKLKSVDLSGAVSLRVDGLENESFDVDLSGATKLTASGKTQKLDVRGSGASNLELFELEATDVKLVLSGATNAELHVTESLAGKVSGAGNLRYKGQPESWDLATSGAAEIRSVK